MIKEAATNGNHELRYGKEIIPFTIDFGSRKRLSISVYPDKSVKVRAPEKYSMNQILPRIERRAFWVIKQRNYFERFHPLPAPKVYLSGETHYYLGRQYRLKVTRGRKEAVYLKGAFFQIQTRNQTNSARIRQLLCRWYGERALCRFTFRLAELYQCVKKYGVSQPYLSIKDMKRRWGSCTKAGKIILNLRLIQAPADCIDYVIMHELAHLVVHNHSSEYYRLLTRMMPDWQHRKKRLETIII